MDDDQNRQWWLKELLATKEKNENSRPREVGLDFRLLSSEEELVLRLRMVEDGSCTKVVLHVGHGGRRRRQWCLAKEENGVWSG